MGKKLFLAVVVELPTGEECAALGERLIEEIRPHVGPAAECVWGVGDADDPVEIASGPYREVM